ncbi:hypothetical protein L529_0481 [Bordetella bronchiseptica MBORD901]|nr:hypothetical protein L529_0481 [Bordetella bronchiseptica MBORD901]
MLPQDETTFRPQCEHFTSGSFLARFSPSLRTASLAWLPSAAVGAGVDLRARISAAPLLRLV